MNPTVPNLPAIPGQGHVTFLGAGPGDPGLLTLRAVEALARALLLDSEQHRHLRALAGLATAEGQTRTDDVSPRLQRLVDAAAPNIASIYDLHLDYVVWNTPYTRLRNDPATLPADRRNLLWMMFTDTRNRALMVSWESAARAVLSQFRAAVGRRPDDPRFATLVTELREVSLEFREWWAEYPVRGFRPATIGIEHPQLGRLDLEMFQFRPVEYPDLLMVLQIPAGEADLRRITSLLEA